MASAVVPTLDVSALFSSDGTLRPYHADDSAWATFAKEVRSSCLDLGFLVIRGHGVAYVPALEAATTFFALPVEEKQRHSSAADNGYRGYTGVGGGHNCSACSTVEIKETFYCCNPAQSKKQLVPELPNFHSRLDKFYVEMKQLADLMIMGLSLSLDLDPLELKNRGFNNPTCKLLLAQYPQHKDGIGCGAHTDCGFMTMLFGDGQGLEVRTSAGEWLAIGDTSGNVVFNIGDLAQRWTNGVYKSTAHRVVNSANVRRTSVIFFNNGDDTAKVVALPGTVADSSQPLYEETTCAEFVQARLAHMHSKYEGETAFEGDIIAEPEKLAQSCSFSDETPSKKNKIA